MTDAEKQEISTLAAGIIAGRGAKTVADFKTALNDAKHILQPRPLRPDYKAWQEANGLTPSTPEQDAASAKKRAEKRKAAV